MGSNSHTVDFGRLCEALHQEAEHSWISLLKEKAWEVREATTHTFIQMFFSPSCLPPSICVRLLFSTPFGQLFYNVWLYRKSRRYTCVTVVLRYLQPSHYKCFPFECVFFLFIEPKIMCDSLFLVINSWTLWNRFDSLAKKTNWRY